ncbi:MAG: dihydrodipicolinate synthase family protein [Planctomycetales bacterium]|nr:dihydrodipicolinate synthase family protein [Planctomycetales bacterium]
MPIKLIAAPHTPLDPTGKLAPMVIADQARYLKQSGVAGVFVGGSTGEYASLTVAERMTLAETWIQHGHSAGLQVIVQVGHNCQIDAIQLADHANGIGADAISSLAPGYFKPNSASELVHFLTPIAAAAPQTPFYFYDIPVMTGVNVSTVDVLRLASELLPNLAGIKYTNPDLIQFQECLRYDQGRYEIWFGCDEALLAGYALGARGAVGSTYNFAAPLYHSMIDCYENGDHEQARKLQSDSIALIRICQSFGYMAAAKAVMSFLGVDCGPVRPPLMPLNEIQLAKLREKVLGLDSLRALMDISAAETRA